MKQIVAISTSSFGEVDRSPLDALERAGCEIRPNPHGRTLTQDEAREHLAGVVGLLAGTEKLDDSVLEAAPDLRVISRIGSGVDNVDHASAERRKIQVFNTPDAHVDAVAELTLGGILAALRRTPRADREIRAGGWKKPMGRLLRGSTVAIVGFGKVGRALVALLQPFDVTALAVDPVLDAETVTAAGAQLTSLDQALPAADVVSLHMPYSAGVRHLIGVRQLGMLRSNCVVVNTSRGGLIDENALAAFLRDNPESFAYLDCFEAEPYAGPLAELSNALLTPHIGSYAQECRIRMESEAVDNLLRALPR